MYTTPSSAPVGTQSSRGSSGAAAADAAASNNANNIWPTRSSIRRDFKCDAHSLSLHALALAARSRSRCTLSLSLSLHAGGDVTQFPTRASDTYDVNHVAIAGKSRMRASAAMSPTSVSTAAESS